MYMQAFFEMEADLSSHKAVSVNEARAVVKNRIEEKKLLSRFKTMNMEAKFNFLNLIAIRNDAARMAKDITTNSGYADCSKEYHTEHEIMLQNKAKMDALKSKIIERNRSDSIDSSSSSYSDEKHVKFDNDSSASNSTASINYDRFGNSFNLRSSKVDARKVQSAFGMSTNEKLIEKHKNQRNSIAFGKSKEVPLTKSQVTLDKLKKRSPKEIEILKQKDPIFAKRHKQFINAKICNKAPKFDYNDFYIKIVPESKFRRNRSGMMDKNRDDDSEQPRLLKAEMEKLDHKVKKFIQNFSTHTF